MSTLTQERLKELLHYDAETGIFTRIKGGNGKNNNIGDIAGYKRPDDYIQICIDCKIYYAHRLAFLYMTGSWPVNEGEHKDNIRYHNWWDNLRDGNHSQNMQNQKKARRNNKSTGILGVTDSPNKDGSFRAQIGINGKTKHLGYFKTPIEAHEAYLSAKRELHEFNTL